ncbi:MAG: MBL fold metallo-hydrolase [Thermoplasmata archaeon]|nr:MBL fold metallo-hydrolase [Thermoplasmata archaeon]
MTFRITFLGTGGGRHTTMYQVRSTGGMLIEHDGKMLNVDPGPSALVNMHRIHYDVCRTNSLIISHCHPDHYSDAESVAEGMSRGGWERKGHIYGSATVIKGEGGLGPCLSNYHLSIVEGYQVFRPGDILDVDGLKVEIKEAKHSDPTNVGFIFHTEHGTVSYVSDTEFTEEIAKQYIGTRVLILPVTTPMGNRIKYHLCTDDAIKFIDIVKPELAIFIHLGVVIIKRDPDKQAAITQEATGVRTIAGRDLMVLDVGEELELSDAETFDDLWIPSTSP